MKPSARPVYLDLTRIRLPLPGWVSILHRVTGVVAFVALPVLVGVLSLSLSGEAGFERVSALARQSPVRLAAVALVWVFSHHFFAGVRHLLMDAHLGVSLADARRSARWVFAAGAAVMLAFAAWMFA